MSKKQQGMQVSPTSNGGLGGLFQAMSDMFRGNPFFDGLRGLLGFGNDLDIKQDTSVTYAETGESAFEGNLLKVSAKGSVTMSAQRNTSATSSPPKPPAPPIPPTTP